MAIRISSVTLQRPRRHRTARGVQTDREETYEQWAFNSKLTVPQLFKQFPASYRTRMFVTVLTIARYRIQQCSNAVSLLWLPIYGVRTAGSQISVWLPFPCLLHGQPIRTAGQPKCSISVQVTFPALGLYEAITAVTVRTLSYVGQFRENKLQPSSVSKIKASPQLARS
jgi:hypothetical protein